MAGIKISDLVVAPVIAGDIVITQRGSANYGGTLGDQITAIESLIEAFQSDTSTAALSIKVDQNNLYTNSTASILFDNNNGTTVGRILWDETSSTFNLGYGANSHLTINSSGNVGIGTVTPGNLLHVAGGVTTNLDALHLSGTSFADGETLGMTMGRAAVVMGRISVESAGAGQAGHMHLGTASGGVNTNHITLRSSGKVGIGTTSPLGLLTVEGSPMFIRNGLLASQKEQMRLGRSDDSGANIRYHSIDTKHASAAASNALILKVHDGSSTTAQTSVMTLLGNGRVGIGTTSPNETLHVDGTVMLENLPTSDPSNTGELWNDSGTLKISA